MKHILGALFLSLLIACGGAQVKPLPAFYSAANVDHPNFPRSRFLAAPGLSTVSAADADERAKANVSAQISAELQSETSSFQQFTSSTGNTAEQVTSKVFVKSSFERADLIRIAEREQQGDTFYSFAVLDRGATDRELASEANANLTSFKAAAEDAKRARAEGNTGVFSTAAAEAARVRPKLDSNFIVRRAVMSKQSWEEPAYVKLRNELLALLAEAKSRRVVGVVLKSAAGSHLSDYTVNAVKRLGMRPDTSTCDKREKKDLTDATQLDVDAEENCHEGQLGETCEVTVRLTALACAGGTAGEGTVPRVKVTNPSDREKARKGAWDKLTPAAIEAAVRDALKSAIQIGE